MNGISSKDISSTFGDSMSRMDKPERQDPFLKETLFDLMEKYDGNFDLFISDTCKQFNYIEVQLWNDKYIKDSIIKMSNSHNIDCSHSEKYMIGKMY